MEWLKRLLIKALVLLIELALAVAICVPLMIKAFEALEAGDRPLAYLCWVLTFVFIAVFVGVADKTTKSEEG